MAKPKPPKPEQRRRQILILLPTDLATAAYPYWDTVQRLIAVGHPLTHNASVVTGHTCLAVRMVTEPDAQAYADALGTRLANPTEIQAVADATAAAWAALNAARES